LRGARAWCRVAIKPERRIAGTRGRDRGFAELAQLTDVKHEGVRKPGRRFQPKLAFAGRSVRREHNFKRDGFGQGRAGDPVGPLGELEAQVRGHLLVVRRPDGFRAIHGHRRGDCRGGGRRFVGSGHRRDRVGAANGHSFFLQDAHLLLHLDELFLI